MSRWSSPIAAILLATAVAGTACDPGDSSPPGVEDPMAKAETLRTEVERGAVRVVLELDPAEPRLSDEPTFRITVDADAGVEVELPPFGDSIGGFVVRGFVEPLPELESGRRRLRQEYRLEPVRTGEHEIRSFTVRFKDDRTQGDGELHEVVTEPLRVEVTSMLSGQAPSLDDVRPPVAPELLPVPTELPWRLITAAGALLAIVVVLLAWRRFRTRKAVVEPILTPTELAQVEFEELLRDDPLGRGELPTFFVELTLIVRRFIERTTGVRAPEQTTDEFLVAMRGHPDFTDEQSRKLQAFLESADLVKFAAFRPSADDIEASFRRAQQFVGLPGTLELSGGVSS